MISWEGLHFGASDLQVCWNDFAWQVQHSYDLPSLFRGRWGGKNSKRSGTRLSAQHSTFHFWRKSRRIPLILMLSSSKIAEFSQNCFAFGVVQFKNDRACLFWPRRPAPYSFACHFRTCLFWRYEIVDRVCCIRKKKGELCALRECICWDLSASPLVCANVVCFLLS